MQIGMIEGATRVVGKSQGYLGLPIRDETFNCPVNGPGTPRMVTAWTLEPDETAKLVLGASIHVSILGTTPPPMMLNVGPLPEDAHVTEGECPLCHAGGPDPKKQKFRIVKHPRNQHGWPVSLAALDSLGRIKDGFVLGSFPTELERDTYARQFANITGFPFQLIVPGQ